MNAQDFQEALRLFRSANVPITEAGSLPTQRASTSYIQQSESHGDGLRRPVSSPYPAQPVPSISNTASQSRRQDLSTDARSESHGAGLDFNRTVFSDFPKPGDYPNTWKPSSAPELYNRTQYDISFGTPRPSTAPLHQSGCLTNDLPPIRELPFKLKKPERVEVIPSKG